MPRLTIVFVGLLSLPILGCAHFNVTESVWLHPGYAVMAEKAVASLNQPGGYVTRPVFFAGADGTRLHGILGVKPGNKLTVLYFGGDSFQTGYGGLEVGQLLESLGVNFLLVDYRGYGGSEGQPTLLAIDSDAVSAYDFVHAQSGISDIPIVVHGFSMGSMIAPYLATHRPIAGLVLESTATDVRDWAENAVPWYGVPFVRINLEDSLTGVSNVDTLRHYAGPLMLVVGSDDSVTPPKFSQSLYGASATPPAMKLLYIAPHKEHGEAFEDQGAIRSYGKFLDDIVLAGR